MVATRIEPSAHQPDTCFSIMPVNNRKKKMCRDQKVIILGDGGVGKTSLLHSIASSSSTSPDFRTKMATINHNIVKLQLWDTADQEKFGAKRLPNSYYRNAHGAFLVYDATNRNTFEAIVQWASQLTGFYHGQPFGVVLVATNAENNRIVSTQEGERLAMALDAEYTECDAGSEDDGIDCFTALVNAMSRKSVWTADMESTIAVFKAKMEEPIVEIPSVLFQCVDTITDNQMEEEYEDNQVEEEPMDEPIPSTKVVKALKSVLPIARQLRRRSVQIIDSNLPTLSISSPRWKRAMYVSGCAAFAVAFMVGQSSSVVRLG